MVASTDVSEELAIYGRTLRDWSVSVCRPLARQVDIDHSAPESWPEIFDSCPVPLPRWDRPDQNAPDFADGRWVSDLVLHENLSYGDCWPVWQISSGIGDRVVQAMGTPAQIDRWCAQKGMVPPRTAFGLTEPHFGSDTSQVATTATRDGGNWVLNGSKMYCSLGSICDYTIVFATIDRSAGRAAIAAFVVPRDTPGYNVIKANESKLGIRSSITTALQLENCIIPLENRLGWDSSGPAETSAAKSGQAAALGVLTNNRPNMSAIGVGLALASIDIARERLAGQEAQYTTVRWQAALTSLTQMSVAIERCRRVIFTAQRYLDEGTPDRSLSAMAKAYAPETCERVIRRCMALVGPAGTDSDLLLEKWYRDVKILDIFEGSGQINRLLVARGMMGRVVG